jgi:hypothetical protein
MKDRQRELKYGAASTLITLVHLHNLIFILQLCQWFLLSSMKLEAVPLFFKQRQSGKQQKKNVRAV